VLVGRDQGHELQFSTRVRLCVKLSIAHRGRETSPAGRSILDIVTCEEGSVGASGWSYRRPYRADVAAVLAALRQEVYETGDFYREPESPWARMTEAEFVAEAMDKRGEVDEDELALFRASKIVPFDPDSLLRSQPESGTHSIIDLPCGVAPKPGWGTVSPLTAPQLLDLFGTSTPAPDQVEAATDRICELRKRWEGAYIVSYLDGTPAEIHFAGFSGD
jgi:hypothetical protein